jgi:hypothetical protein
MIKKLVAIGNSQGIVIDRAILELLKITPETELELSTDGVRLIIEPIRNSKGQGKRKGAPPMIDPPEPPHQPGGGGARIKLPRKQPW